MNAYLKSMPDRARSAQRLVDAQLGVALSGILEWVREDITYDMPNLREQDAVDRRLLEWRGQLVEHLHGRMPWTHAEELILQQDGALWVSLRHVHHGLLHGAIGGLVCQGDELVPQDALSDGGLACQIAMRSGTTHPVFGQVTVGRDACFLGLVEIVGVCLSGANRAGCCGRFPS